MAIVYINTTATTVGAVIQPAPLSVTDTLVTLDDLDLSGLPDGTIFIAFETDSGLLSNWIQATKLSLDGSGALLSQVATIDSSGNQVLDPIEGSGDLASEVATASGAGDIDTGPALITGTGDLASEVATFIGDGDRVIYQTGSRVDLLSQAASMDGSGTLKHTITQSTADLQAQVATLTGVGSKHESRAASGALQAQTVTVAGASNIAALITGTGDLDSDVATASGSGFKLDTKDGTGDLQAVGADIAGAGNIIVDISGNGVLVSGPAGVVGSGFKFGINQTISIPVAAVGPYDGLPDTTYSLSVPVNIESIEFIWSSDDPEYINGNLSVELRLIDAQGELVLASMNASSPANNEPSAASFTLYDTQGKDTLQRFERLTAALALGPATIRISGYDDLTTFVNPFSQDGGLMIHNVDIAA